MAQRHVLMAPGTSSSASLRLPGKDQPLPVDERLVMPEQRYEVIEGQVVHATPSDQPHGTAVMDLARLLGAHIKPGYLGAVDMLMRSNRFSDFAPDASIFPKAKDPETGGRKLEELVFEIIDSQPLSDVTRKARLMMGRGVRKVFCVDLPKKRVLRWSVRKHDWAELGEGIVDSKCLVKSIPVKALLNAAEVDEATAAALLAKGTMTLTLALEEREAKGKADGLREGENVAREIIADLCELLGIELTKERRATLNTLDLAEISRLRLRIKQRKAWPR